MTKLQLFNLFKTELRDREIYYQSWINDKDESIFILTEYGLGDMIKISDLPGEEQLENFKKVKYYIGEYVGENKTRNKAFYRTNTEENVKNICDCILNDTKNRIRGKSMKGYAKELKKRVKEQHTSQSRFFTSNDLFRSFELERIRLNKILNKNGMSVEQVKQSFLAKLKKEDLFVQVYDAFTTNSVYIKFDFGVANSLRISDHKGKGYPYRFNIRTDINQIKEEVVDGKKRIYFPNTPASINKLIEMIVGYKKEKIKKYGRKNYISYLKEDRKKGEMLDSSFWRESELVQEWDY